MKLHYAAMILLGVMAATAGAQGVNKCTLPSGKIAYQQTPCTITGGGEKIGIKTPEMSKEQLMDTRLSGQSVNARPATKAEIKYCVAIVAGPLYSTDSENTAGTTIMKFFGDGFAVLSLVFDLKGSDGTYIKETMHRCIFDPSGKITQTD